MPYINKEKRSELEFYSYSGGYPKSPTTAGELNYQLTQVCLNYLHTPHNYQKLNDIIGALEACKMEFYRRVVAPYEDQKIKENGDVF